MEDGLVIGATLSVTVERYGLNPCCSGRWSRTLKKKDALKNAVKRS